MKPDPAVIDALNACLVNERALVDLFGGYYHYFARWRIHRLRDWCEDQKFRAVKRQAALLDRINQLDTIPTPEHEDVVLQTVETAEDIEKVVKQLLSCLKDYRKAYEDARGVAKDDKDSVTAKLLGRNKAGVECGLWRVEAKQRKIQLIGPVEYLGHHMHPET